MKYIDGQFCLSTSCVPFISLDNQSCGPEPRHPLHRVSAPAPPRGEVRLPLPLRAPSQLREPPPRVRRQPTRQLLRLPQRALRLGCRRCRALRGPAALLHGRLRRPRRRAHLGRDAPPRSRVGGAAQEAGEDPGRAGMKKGKDYSARSLFFLCE